MKKALAGLLTATMIISLTACLPTGNANAGDKDSNDGVATISSNSNSGSDNTNIADNGNQNIEQNPVNPDDNANAVNTETGAKYKTYPVYSAYDYNVKDKYSVEGDYSSTKVIDTLYTNIYINSEYNNDEYKELADKIQKVNKDNEENLTEIFDGFVSDYGEMFADVDLNWGPVLYEYDHKGVIRADQKIFSTGNNAEVYYGGAHGGNFVGGRCYDSQTGEEITFNDVFLKTDGLADIITDKLYENYDKEIFFSETREELKEDVQMYVDELTDKGGNKLER